MTIRAVLLVIVAVGWWRLPAALAAECEFKELAPSTMRRAGVLTVGVAAILAMGSGPLLNALEVDTETFRIATGLAVVGLGLARVLGWGLAAEAPEDLANGWVWPVAYPVLIGPELVVVAISVGSDHGWLITAASALVGVLLASFAAQKCQSPGGWAPRLRSIGVRGAGVVLILLAVALVFDGLRDI